MSFTCRYNCGAVYKLDGVSKSKHELNCLQAWPPKSSTDLEIKVAHLDSICSINNKRGSSKSTKSITLKSTKLKTKISPNDIIKCRDSKCNNFFKQSLRITR